MNLGSRLSVSLLFLVGTLAAAAVLLAPDNSESTSSEESPASSKNTSQPKSDATKRRKDFWGIYQAPVANPSKGPSTSKSNETAGSNPQAKKVTKDVFDIREWSRERPSRLEKELDKALGIEEVEEESDNLWSHRSRRTPTQKGPNKTAIDRILDKVFPEPKSESEETNLSQTGQEDAFDIITLKRRASPSETAADYTATFALENRSLNNNDKSNDNGSHNYAGNDIVWNQLAARDGPNTLFGSTELWFKGLWQENDWNAIHLAKNSWESIKNNIAYLGNPRQTVFTLSSSHLDVHSGPSQNYPAYQVIERGEQVTLINSKFGWYQVETPRGDRGWINGALLLNELKNASKPLIGAPTPPSLPWAVGISAGAFEQETYLQFLVDYPLTQQLSLQVLAGSITETLSNAYLYQVGIKQSLLKTKSFNSAVFAHVGHFENQPSQTAVDSNTADGSLFSMGLGVEFPINPSFSITAEAKQHFAFIDSRDADPYTSVSGGILFKHNTDLHRQTEKYLNNRIDQDNKRIGLYSGLYSADHLDTALVYGVYFTQHINDRLQVALNWAQTDLSTKALEGLLNINAAETLTLQYVVAQTEYSLFQGEILTGKTQQMANLYASTGFGVTEFGQRNFFTIILGTGVSIDFNDWLSLNTAVRTHILEDNPLESSQTSYNIEVTSGINLVF
ncbi:MAG: hypothetical protein COB51_11965 [Moraxellaceae bacterium]|nr:MAG: hypothetical protein COB51_11965 [Moraxellaceae bacterium]